MSIKFPDMQVLMTRQDQVPRVTREGDPSQAGKMAPQVAEEFEDRKKKVTHSAKSSDARLSKEEKEKPRKKTKEEKQKGNRLDLRA